MDQARLQRVKEVFSEARGLPADELASALGRLCAGDADLELEVRAMLEADARAGEFLSQSRLGSIAASVLSDRVGERIGSRIGPYQLLELIGEGGFGEVYLAEQIEPIRRRVALKVIKLGMDTRQVVARFEHERQALAMMDHPCIARVLDAGATPSGRPYFVMELVRGDPITTFCDARRLGVPERLALVRQVCSAVQHAHQKGIIHRDIKPSNVLVTLVDGERPMPKIIDFGIALATQGRLTDRTMFTEFRQFVGTPVYMSPEQAGLGGEGGLHVDTRTDIYSLGVLLYELLTGATPFDAQTLSRAAFEEVRRIIREVDPPRPSARVSALSMRDECAARRGLDPPTLASVVRGDLDWAVMRCLEKDRARRYATPEDLGRDIDRYLRSEPLEAGPPTAWYRARKFVGRHRVGVTVAAAIAGVVVVGVVGTGWAAIWALNERQRAERSEQSAIQEQQRAESAARAEALARADAEQAALDAQIVAYRLSIGAAITAASEGRTGLMREVLAGAPENLRGWEWRWLWARANARVWRLDTPENTDALLLFGDEVIARGSDGVVRIFDSRTGQPLRTFPTRPGPTASPYSISASRAASLLVVTAREDARGTVVSAWDLRTGAPMWDRPFVGSGGATPDGARFLMPVAGGFVWLDARTGRELEPPVDLDFTPTHAIPRGEGTRALVALGGGEWQLWSLDDQRPITTFFASEVAGDVAGGWLYYADASNRLQRVHTVRGDHEALPVGAIPGATALDALGMGLISARRSRGLLSAVDPASGHLLATVNIPEGTRALRGSTDGRTQISLDADGGISVWDLAVGDQPLIAPVPDRGLYAGAIDQACERTATVGWGDVGAYDARTGENLWSAYPSRGGFHAAAFSPDSALLAVGGADDSVHVLDGATGRARASIPLPGGIVTSLAWSPDGGRLVAGLNDGRVLCAAVHASDPTWTQWPDRHDGAISALAFTPDGGRVIVACCGRFALHDAGTVSRGGENSLSACDAGTGAVRARADSPVGGPVCLAISRDGRTIVAGGRTGLALLDPDSMAPLRHARTEMEVHAIAIAPGGDRIAAVGSTHLVRLFEPARLDAVTDLNAWSDRGRAIRFSPDGDRLIVASAGRPVTAFECAAPPDPARRMLATRASLALRGLFESCGFVSEEVVERLLADQSLHEDVRAMAIEQARTRGNDPNRINNAIILALRQFPSDRARAERLVSRAESAIRAAPEATGFQTTLAVALLRAGEFERAIATATRNNESALPTQRARLAMNGLVIALATHHQGKPQEARQALREALILTAAPDVAADRDVAILLAEAQTLIPPAPDGR